MSINTNYDQYLKHFRSVVPVRELGNQPDTKNLIALRHDVDHDLDIALELAHYEHKRDVRSTYYLLDTESYWQDLAFDDKILQLHDYGHEIGLHINVLSKWITGKVTDIREDLQNSLNYLRNLGIPIDTISAHGDKLCYQHQFINYWCFRELRPDNPETAENGMTAEGIRTDDEQFQIRYPSGQTLKRKDGKNLPLWSVDMVGLGIKHHAMHIPVDRYFTDSGGSWKRSPDPLEQNLENGRYQIVMHPEYWRGPQKIYFFLSAPRSGSTWLANFINKATPLTGQHEFLLNHEFTDNTLQEFKRTSHGINSLIEDKDKTMLLLKQGRAWIEATGRDYGEANVYLHHFMSEITEIYPDAKLIHLHRHPQEVVRSLYNRDWYGLPETPRNPSLDIPDWSAMSRMERICWFVRSANEALTGKCDDNLSFETMTEEPEKFVTFLEEIGIAVYPRLAEPLFGKVLNQNATQTMPSYEKWERRYQDTFNEICAPLIKKLGYEDDRGYRNENILKRRLRRVFNKVRFDLLNLRKPILYKLRLDNTTEIADSFWTRGCDISVDKNCLQIKTHPDKHTIIMPGEGQWDKLHPSAGWPNNIGNWYTGHVRLSAPDKLLVTLFCLMYNQEGEQIHKEAVARVFCENINTEFAFKPRPDAARFSLAIYITASDNANTLELRELGLSKKFWSDAYL